MDTQIVSTSTQDDYELIDSGEGEKLERFGEIVLARPDPQALWPKRLTAEWDRATGIFNAHERQWKLKAGIPRQWPITFAGAKFLIRPSAFKHTGLFPEQRPNWEWISENINAAGKRDVSVLNLFGYTGGATLAAARAGAEVTHLDGSRAAIGWARENAALSDLARAPIRWILDDARSFVRREIRRGRRYDGIILDPPAFGRGPKGEVWKIEDDFLQLLDLCRQALSPQPLFFLVNGYAAGYSAISYANAVAGLFPDGTITAGELALTESGPAGRLLPAGIFSRVSWL